MSSIRVETEVNPGARLLVVGEAPGEEEVEAGKPFVGKSGKLLFGTLERHKMQRSQFVVTNVCKYRPPANDIKKAKKEWMAEGLEELEALISTLQPLAILAVGGTALTAVLGMQGITARRGSLYTHRLGAPVIPVLHPAAVLRSSKDAVLFDHDIQRFGELINGRLPANLERRLVINPTGEDLAELSDALRAGTVCAVDIEAEGRELACVGFAVRPDYAVCIPASTPEYRAAIRDFLGRNCTWVFHNSPYDVAFLTQRCGYRLGGRIEDTLAQHQALHPEMPRDLATLTSLYTLQPFYKDMFHDESLDNFWRYNCLDCCVTREIWDCLDRRLDATGLRGVYQSTLDVLPYAIGMSGLGLRYDRGKADDIRTAVTAEITELQAHLNELAGRELNVFSAKQMAKFLYGDLKLPGKKAKVEGGDSTTSQKYLIGLYAKIPDPHIRDVLVTVMKIRAKRKFVSSYLKVRLSPDGRCRTTYNPMGTETGRWSASKYLITEGANLQTIPPVWKPCFIADDGMVLWMADYSQIEARFVAWLANDKEQMAIFRDPKGDIHKFNASRIFGVPFSEVTDDQRQVGKSIHALNYGVGPPTLTDFVNKRALETGFWMTLDFAKRIRTQYLDQFEAIVRWQKRTWKQVQATRTMVNPFGRKRIFLGSTKDPKESEHTMKEALAFVPQSTVPDLMNQALIDLWEHPPCEGFAVAMQVHDALGGWGPADKVDVWAPAIIRAMDIPVYFETGECRVPVELKIGPRLSEMKKWQPS